MPSLRVAIHRELSGTNAQAITAEITKFHRPPGAAGYHAATNLVHEHLKAFGLKDITVSTYPLDGETVAGYGPLPMAWEPYSARVRVVNPAQEEVVDSESASSCLAWWSMPTPPGGLTAELIDVGTGESDADWDGKDVAGKIVLIGHTERPGGWMYAARRALEKGAAGILSDYLFYTFEPHRTRESLPEAVQLLRLPNPRGAYNAWACSISRPAAQRLRELLKLGPVQLHADIDCRLFVGSGQNLLCTIPGRELPEEAVYFIAHTSAATCPCANCAAGPALMAEIARTLNHLIETGRIEQPRRSIKFLFIIEGLGSRTYIQENPDELTRTKAAICFDSVGHDQSKLKSSLLFYRHPDSFPSYINDYFAEVMERAPKDTSWVFANNNDLSSVRFYQAPYTPWSDNHIWSAYGIPSPLIMSWPDKYFHTQFLTADKTDPNVFRRAGITSAIAAYEIANAGPAEAMLIADQVAARSGFRLAGIANQAAQRIVELGAGQRADAEAVANRAFRELRYCANRDAQAIASTLALVPGGASESAQGYVDELAAALTEQAARAEARVEAALRSISDEEGS